MDVRIGIADSPQVVEVELAKDVDREAFKSSVESAIAGQVTVLWVTDRKGKEVAIPAAKIGFVEVGSAEAERKIGFA